MVNEALHASFIKNFTFRVPLHVLTQNFDLFHVLMEVLLEVLKTLWRASNTDLALFLLDKMLEIIFHDIIVRRY